MVKHWEKVIDGIGNFIGFPEMNYGITLVVSFYFLPLVLGDQGCGRRKRK